MVFDLRALTINNTTTGAPNSAVTEFIGSTVALPGSCEITSQMSISKGPTKITPGNTVRWFTVLNKSLVTWGTVMPIKAIGPVNAVSIPANKLEIMIIFSLVRLTFTPDTLAWASPISIISMGFIISMLNTIATKKKGSIILMWTQLVEPRLPNDQMTNLCTVSALAKNCNIPTSADARLPIIIPTINSETVSLILNENKRTKKKTRLAPIIAETAWPPAEKTGCNPINNTEAIVYNATPSPAPELIPKT